MPRTFQLVVIVLACGPLRCQSYDRETYRNAQDAAMDAPSDGADDEAATDAPRDVPTLDTPDTLDDVVVPAVDSPIPDTSVDAAPVNLVRNPSFETMTAPWNSYQSSASRVLRSDAVDGQYVAEVDAVIPDAGNGLYTLDDGATSIRTFAPGDTFVASAWVRAANMQSVGQTAFIAMRQNVGTGSGLAVESDPVMLSDVFQQVRANVTIGSGYTSVSVYIGSHGGPGSGFQTDQVVVARVGP